MSRTYVYATKCLGQYSSETILLVTSFIFLVNFKNNKLLFIFTNQRQLAYQHFIKPISFSDFRIYTKKKCLTT